MPWALGTMHEWSQSVSLAMAATALGLALIPRHYTSNHAPDGDFRLILWRRLLHFRLFWIGGLLLIYILTQALNPAWVYRKDTTSWWLEAIPHISWLPTGMITPYHDMNPWRVLVIWSTAFMLACALWIGITRRKSITLLFSVVTANAALWALVGILQKASHASYILWYLKSANTSGGFFSAIIYKNHAGAYLNLGVMLSIAMAWWHSQRAKERMHRTSPAPLFILCAAVISLGVPLSNCKTATLLLSGFIFCVVLAMGIRLVTRRESGRNHLLLSISTLAIMAGMGIAGYAINVGQTFDRVHQFLKAGAVDKFRDLGRQATWDMAKDNLITGWGAGSFRHYFPVYQRSHPEINVVFYDPRLRFRWEYAHNDYVQLLAEMGLCGAVLVTCGLCWTAVSITRQRFYRKPYLLLIAGALITTLMHAWVDFQFHNPAILVLWSTTLTLFCRWSELEAARYTG